MILVVGATGLLGHEICHQLADQSETVRALIRKTSDQNKVEQLKKAGAQLIYGDLKEPESLTGACLGVESIISTASSTFSRQEGDSIQTVDLQGQQNLVMAAKNSGVKHFTYISFPDDPGSQSPLSIAKRQVEQQLKESGIRYSTIQASFFMEVWLSSALGFDFSNATVKIYGDGKNKISWISYKDVAKYAIMSLNNPEVHNKIIEAGGPEAMSQQEVVQIFEEVSGKTFSVEYIPVEALQVQESNAKDPLQQSFASLMLSYAAGASIDMGEMNKTFSIQLTSVHDYAKNVLSQ
jgi:uncharacterized protein YbjT (DUF2867 family)